MATTLPVGTAALSQPGPTNLSRRLMSLDVFRGVTIAAMILVNDPGDGPSAYWPLQHAKWNGWTPTDLVFPFFLFIVGVAMAFSFQSRIERGDSKGDLFRHALWRGLVLFAFGLFVNAFPNRFHLSTWRVYGVLQRIAICYVITSAMALWTGRKTQIITAVACLAGYWIIMRYVPVPGFGVPTHDIPILDHDRNLVAWLDRKLLLGHLYEGTRDPEGLISTIPSVAGCLIGLLTGEWLRSERTRNAKAAAMAVTGVIFITAAEIFNLWFPINKKLWTSSFVFLTSGCALVGLALCYWALDIREWRGLWTRPWLVFGRNAITAYVFSEMLAGILYSFHYSVPDDVAVTWHELVYSTLFAPLANPANASLLFSLCFVLVCLLVIWGLDRKGIYLKV
jgi:predicted acyltransferase